ncbi:hypothetical protein AVDCRST_MAG92-3777 [uncultured Coleofasciculus sp.]|uniref:Uncharacterized protein n=1 Tax=uncultured Coleofasciculus sp. TaxID=1267456 RepID=A0A6J4JPW8_9CYAN|nr:hypothetical protein AVDCRST_MAG92-3777 [uncultured Coleofasciculus sp.]
MTKHNRVLNSCFLNLLVQFGRLIDLNAGLSAISLICQHLIGILTKS